MLTENQKRLCISVQDLAKAMDISLPTAYDLAHRADFPALRLGRKIVIPKAAFEKWLDEIVSGGKAEIAIGNSQRGAR